MRQIQIETTLSGHIGWAAFSSFLPWGLALQLATLQLPSHTSRHVLANRHHPARPAIGASGFHGLTQPSQSEAFDAIDPARPPSHEHDMCQPCGGPHPSPRKVGCNSANLARHLVLLPHPGRPDASGHQPAPCPCLGPLQASMSAQRCCIRSALRLRKRRALGAWQQDIPSIAGEPLRSYRSAAPAELAVGTAVSQARLSAEHRRLFYS